MLNSLIGHLILAILSLFNPLLSILAIPDLFTKSAEIINNITGSSGWTSFLDYVSFVFYFVPKSTISLLLGFSVIILLIRIGLAIAAEIWFG